MKSKALSTVELLIVIAIFLTLMSAVTSQMLGLFFTNELEIAGQEMHHTLRRANSLAVNQVHDSAWGVQFDEINQSYTLFSGTGYETRTTSRDQVFYLPDTISYSAVVLNGSATGVVFNQGTGRTSQYGTITLVGSDEVKVIMGVSILGGSTLQ
ncbi:MAG: hypothetical protein AAB802_04950, partial [Patescibacteria group bacterium]